MGKTGRIHAWEPWFFLFFGVFHLHRIWGLVDRQSYASFWLGIMENKGWPYFVIMGVLAALCVLGIVTFIRELGHNFWWRWVYIGGGAYLLFDLFAIATGMRFWNELIMKMFDTTLPYWNVIWSAFILLGGAVFVLGIILLRKRVKT
ncbi:hypothetical protein SAMN02910456_02220 [Ruminococcaceae bacterium YRB3002]|nr:hypothetical protein SAMN02910456_02220 [Ruminococcaceae bacterium YRB3002]